MAVLPIQISENGRQRLCTVLWVLHWICAICGLTIISIGVYLRIRIQGKVNLIEGYDGNVLPIMLISVGFITAVIDLFGGRLCGILSNINRRHKLGHFLPFYLLVFLVLNVCIFIAGCTCFAHRSHLHDSFQRGLMKAMKRYQSNKAIKSEINLLQIDFRCCGNNGYEDWFAMQWIGSDYLSSDMSSKMTDGQYLNDDAPYSCCKDDQLRPCIHHHVQDNDMHYNYDYREGLTLHEQGCKPALTVYFSTRLNRIGSIIMVIFILQCVILVLLRYLQTSIKNASLAEDDEGTSTGWLLKTFPFGKQEKEKKSYNDDEPIYENFP